MIRTYALTITAGVALAYCLIVALALLLVAAYCVGGNYAATEFFARLQSHGTPFAVAFLSLPYVCGMVCGYVVWTHKSRVGAHRSGRSNDLYVGLIVAGE